MVDETVNSKLSQGIMLTLNVLGEQHGKPLTIANRRKEATIGS